MRQVLSIIAGLFLVWALFVLHATSARGPGLGPDSMSYLAAAESIARGAGPEIPVAEWSEPADHSQLRHFPPLFPALIALPTAFGVPAAQAARWLEAFAAGTLAALLAWIAVSCVAGARARAAALVTGVSVMLAPAISLSFFMVLSEPLFLMFWAVTLLVMLRAPRASFALGCAAACCALTRYAGVSVVASVALWALWQRGTPPVRCARAAIAAAPSLFGLACWRVWSGGEFRRYAWYLDGFAANAEEAWHTLRHALLPLPETLALEAWQWFVGLAATLLLLAAVLREALQLQAAEPAAAAGRFTALLRAATLMTLNYLGILVVSRLRADPEIPFDWRILSPVILTWQLTLTVAIVRQWDRLRSTATRLAGGALALLWLGAASWNAAHNVSVMRREGALFDGPAWQDSAFATWLRSTGRQYALYSNNAPVLWHLDHRSSWLLPESTDSTTLAALRERLSKRPSALLGFHSAFVSTVAPQTLAAQLGWWNRQCFEQVCVWVPPHPTDEQQEQANAR